MDQISNNNKDHKTVEALKSLNEFAFSTFTTTIFRFGIRLLKNVVFTRLLGPVERGVFGLLTTIPDLIVSFGNLGFGLGSTYLVAKQRYDLKSIIGNILFVTLLLGSCLMGISYIVFSYKGILKGDIALIKIYASLIIFLTPFVLLQNFGSDLLIAIKQIHFVNLLKVILSGLPVILIIILWLYTGEALKSAIYAWMATIIVVSLWSITRVLSQNDFKIKISLSYLKEGFSFGSRGFISILSNAVTRRIDFLFIASMSGAEALGYYAVSVSIAEILLAVPEAFSRPFLPIHLELDDKDAKIFAPIVIRNVLFIMILICLFTMISGKLIIIILFGKGFLPSYSSMLWLLPGVISLSIYQLLKVDMYSRNLPGLVSLNSVLAMSCNLVLNFLLIPSYGIVGAAISSSISYGLSTLVLLIKFIHLSNNSYRGVLLINKSDIGFMWNKFILNKK